MDKKQDGCFLRKPSKSMTKDTQSVIRTMRAQACAWMTALISRFLMRPMRKIGNDMAQIRPMGDQQICIYRT
jgi:hypothetical protein